MKHLLILTTAEVDEDGNTTSVDHDIYSDEDKIQLGFGEGEFAWAEKRVDQFNVDQSHKMSKQREYRRLVSVSRISLRNDKLRFGYDTAQLLIRAGVPVTRDSWSREDQGLVSPRIFLVNGSKFEVNRAPLNQLYEEGTQIDYFAHIDIEYGEHHVMVWTPTAHDLLGTDWKIAEPTQAAFDVEPNDEDIEPGSQMDPKDH